jgi:hypothetical protein
MMAIEKLAHAALPKVGRELQDLAIAEEDRDLRRGAEGSLILLYPASIGACTH